MIRGHARLADIQAQQVEVGRIRLGTSAPKTSRSGKQYNEPVKLERFRLTSRSRSLIEQAAGLYGGEPGEWVPQGTRTSQWEVIIERDWLEVIVPANPCSQFYEQWASGKCQVRCDGLRELLTDTPCLCGPDPVQRRCKPYTRLSLMLAEMPGIGIWRLETHGYNAAAELPAVADLLSAAGGNVPARLEMEERQAEVPDPRKDDGATMISRFMVPVLHVEVTPAELIAAFTPRAVLEAARREPLAIEADAVAPEAVESEPSSQFPESATLRAGFEKAIAQASLEALPAVGLAVGRAITRMSPQDAASLRQSYTQRKTWLERAASPSASGAATADTRPPPQAPPPADEKTQRQAAWLEVNTLAGFRNITLSGLRQMYTQFGGVGEINQASAAELIRFRDWLKAQ